MSFLVPAYNEAATIVDVLDAVWALDLDKQIVVVDDGSTDGTGDLAEAWGQGRAGIVVVRQDNRGKGAAVRAAIPHVDGDIAVIQDADLERLKEVLEGSPERRDEESPSDRPPRLADE